MVSSWWRHWPLIHFWAMFPLIPNLLKRESNTGAFLWILRKFLEQPFFIDHLWWLFLNHLRVDVFLLTGFFMMLTLTFSPIRGNVPISYQLYQKETPPQVLSCECCKIFQNSYFYRLTLVAVSVLFYWLVSSWWRHWPLTHFWAMFPFQTLWKHQKTFGYLVFSGDIE